MIERGQILQNLGGLVSNFGLKVNSNVKKNRIDGIGFAFKKIIVQNLWSMDQKGVKAQPGKRTFTGIQNVDYGHLDQRDVQQEREK